jgi:hypothetical protein
MASTVGLNIVRDGLTFYIDAANPKSYISGSSTVFNMLNSTQTGSFINDVGAIDNSGKSAFVFGLDEVNDTILFNNRFAQASQTDITINIWFKTTGDGASGFNGLVNEMATTNPFRSRILVKNNGTQISYNIAGTQRTVDLSSTIPDDTWTNLTLTKDSSVGSKLYVNSDYQYGHGSDTGTIAGQGGASFPGTVLGVGAESIYFMKGEISNITVYNKALTQTEVTKNYNSLKPRFT